MFRIFRSLQKRLDNTDLFNRLTLIHVSIYCLITAIFISSFSFFIFRNERSDTEKRLCSTAKEMTSRVDSLFYYMDSTVLQLSLNPYVSDMMRSLSVPDDSNAFTDNPLLALNTEQHLMSYSIKQKNVARICLFNEYHDFVYVGSRPVEKELVDASLDDYISQQLKPRFEAGEKKVIFHSFEDNYYPISQLPNKSNLCSIVRQVSNRYGSNLYGTFGYVEVQQTMDALSFLQETPDHIVALLLDADGNELLGQSIPSYFDLSPQEYISYYEQNKQFEPDILFLSGHTGMFSISKSLQSDTYILCAQTNHDAYLHLKRTVVLSISLSLILLLVLIYGEVQIIRKSSESLELLAEEMNHATIDQTALLNTAEVNSNVVKRLNASFERMTECLRHSAQDAIDAKTSEYRSVIKALQSQMDPHFIHNVLAVISAASQEGNMEQVTTMCQQLSEMLRYSSAFKHPDVTIYDEIEYTKNYLQLMHSRFENRLQYEIITDDAMKTVQIPKLTIQPLVENCFKYAFQTKPAPWFIEIAVSVTADAWRVVIRDNGIGFAQEVLDDFERFKEHAIHSKIQKQLEALEINGLSMRNTFLRMWYTYGKNAIFEIGNNPQGGASITIGGTNHV